MKENVNNEFCQYRLSKDIMDALELLGYHTPTPIQQEVIPAMLAGNHVITKAPTGSGKTAAFGIPVCEGIDWMENAPQVLILEPTRELTAQVRDEIFHIGRMKRIKVPALFGGFPIDKQIQTLRQKSHIVVGTPGRVMDHIRRESLELSKIHSLVIDEADLMLDMGFIDEVKEIISLLPSHCKISLFSATLKPEVRKLVEEQTKDAVVIVQEQEEEHLDAITQKIYKVDSENKYEDFIKILIAENPTSCIIFCGTREMVNVLFQKLRRNRIFCGMLHGEMEQKERLKTIDAFYRGGFRFLIATDVAARGIDFDSLSHVFNYDFPTGKATYVHRIGRTGRNGKKGTAVSLIGEEDWQMFLQVQDYIGYKLEISMLPGNEEDSIKEFWNSQRTRAQIKPKKGQELNKGITKISIGGGRKSKIRPVDIVGTICSIDGMTAEDIGVIDIRDSLTYVEVLNQKGKKVVESLQNKPLKGKIRKVRITRNTIE